VLIRLGFVKAYHSGYGGPYLKSKIYDEINKNKPKLCKGAQ